MKKIKVLGLTGPARSGKDTFAQYLIDKFGFQQFDFFKNAILPELEKEKIELTKENASKFTQKLRAKFGLGIVAKKLLEKIKNTNLQNAKGLIITGFRDPKEVEIFQEKFPEMKLVFLTANLENRKKRKGKEFKANEKIEERDKRDSRTGMSEVFKLADFHITNNGTIEEFHEKIISIIKQI